MKLANVCVRERKRAGPYVSRAHVSASMDQTGGGGGRGGRCKTVYTPQERLANLIERVYNCHWTTMVSELMRSDCPDEIQFLLVRSVLCSCTYAFALEMKVYN